MLSLSTRQASAFNQPLSWDTSSVTYMGWMFDVCSARAPASSLHSWVSSACTLLAPLPRPRPPASRPACRCSFYASLSTRQGASAFNQPLSWDTSSVTDMNYMFQVRSARAPASRLHSWVLCLHPACAAAAPTPSRLPARLRRSFMLPFRLGSNRMRSTSR
jgi:hypothetical protein